MADTNLRISISPLSANKMYMPNPRGRGMIKTSDYRNFIRILENELLLQRRPKIEGWVNVYIEIYLTNYAGRDTDNCNKALIDQLVKYGYMDDDRFVKKVTTEKFPTTTNHDYIRVIIRPLSEEVK